MGFLFVLKTKHERIINDFKNNNKILNDERKRLSEKNIELQKEIRQLRNVIESNVADIVIMKEEFSKQIMTKDEMIAKYDKDINKLVAENDKLLKTHISEVRQRKSKKYKEMEKLIKELEKTNIELTNELERKNENKCACECEKDTTIKESNVEIHKTPTNKEIITEVGKAVEIVLCDGAIGADGKISRPIKYKAENKRNNNRKGRK